MRVILKAAIFRQGTTQRRFARQIDLHENRLSAIVQGWADPKPNERHAIAAALGRSEHGLFRNVDPAPSRIEAKSGDAV